MFDIYVSLIKYWYFLKYNFFWILYNVFLGIYYDCIDKYFKL